MRAILALADGTIYEGEHFGAIGESSGEVVFNTSMTGYQEILTDPSYKGQIVTMTYPLIGNYGCNDVDVESVVPQVEGFIVREYSAHYSNWRSRCSLGTYLEEHGVIGIHGVDTRALTKRLRVHGVMNGVLSTEDYDTQQLIAKAQAWQGLIGVDLVHRVTCPSPYLWEDSNSHPNAFSDSDFSKYQSSTQLTNNFDSSSVGVVPEPQFRVIAMDFGIKYNILRQLTHYGCQVQVVPAHTSAEDILSANPNGIFLSNGPGDPDAVDYALETIKKLIGRKPIFGICLGHQLLGLAFGGKRFKLKFGHRGANQPVKRLETNTVEITAQNHGFCVDIDSLPNTVEITHVNLNDQTLEGMRHSEHPVLAVQYHPEASPGPHDASYLFKQFTDLMKRYRREMRH
jgi:carbamoyl-phosphate synthase small subunit